jgi:RNA polymerase II elongation factor ELL
MARHARLAFADMKIPESDPLWSHVKYRNPSSGNGGPGPSNPAGPSTSTAASRAGSLKPKAKSKTGGGGGAVPPPKPKEKKKSSKKPSTDHLTQVKDEGSGSGKPSPQATVLQETHSDTTKPTIRRPGSGYKAKIETHPGGSPPQQQQHPAPTGPSGEKTTTAAGNEAPATHHHGSIGSEHDVRLAKKRMAEASSSSATKTGATDRIPKKSHGGTPADSDVEHARTRDSGGGQTVKKSHGGDNRDKLLERENRELRELLKQEKEKGLSRDKDEKSSVSPSLKRKDLPKDLDHADDSDIIVSLHKKRKSEDDRASSSSKHPRAPPQPSSSSVPRKSDGSLTASPVSHPKIKKDSNPPPSRRSPLPHLSKVDSSASSSHTAPRSHQSSTKHNGGSKPRRKSPIYTSSEDEGVVIHEPPRATISRPVTPAPNMMTMMESKPALPPDISLPQTFAQDQLLVRSRYRKTYREYMCVFKRATDQRMMLEDLLERGSGTEGSDGSCELLEDEELKNLQARCSTLHNELLEIRAQWAEFVMVNE